MRFFPIRTILFFVFFGILIAGWVLTSEWSLFDLVQANHAFLTRMVTEHYGLTLIVFCITYGISAAMAFPLGGLFVLLAGFLFGVVWGTAIAVGVGVVVSLIMFLLIRYFFHDLVERRYGEKLAPLKRELEMHQASYLLFLRFMPIVPYLFIYIAAALSPVRIWTFVWTSIVGLFPGALIFTYAGRELSRISELGDVLSPGFIALLVALGIFSLLPLGYKKFRRWRDAKQDILT